jgi:hypothetical protein
MALLMVWSCFFFRLTLPWVSAVFKFYCLRLTDNQNLLRSYGVHNFSLVCSRCHLSALTTAEKTIKGSMERLPKTAKPSPRKWLTPRGTMLHSTEPIANDFEFKELNGWNLLTLVQAVLMFLIPMTVKPCVHDCWSVSTVGIEIMINRPTVQGRIITRVWSQNSIKRKNKNPNANRTQR